MLNSKQRANLRAKASVIESITQVGKLGINDSLIESLDKAIEKRELIKITVLENSDLVPKEAGFTIAEKLKAEFVCATGRKLVFYRRSSSDKVKHIEY
ncbi:MAG: YhbY family RNA-binding protein [Firmicutes bacterium]|nr:YhbY family RNA-binding protein [Candidatus Caballimonas caccae]